MANILIAGCGSIGNALALNLHAQGHNVTGLKRQPAKPPQAIPYIQADVSKIDTLKLKDHNFQQVVYILSPDSAELKAYQAVFQTGLNNLLAAINSNASITFISSSRVYGQNKAEWVDEHSPALATDAKSQLLIQAEKTVLAHNSSNTVIRFSGIYGRAKAHFLQLVKQGILIQRHPAYFTNRIHQADCIGVITHLLNKKLRAEKLAPLYLASDNEPVTKWQLANYLADQIGCALPQAKPESLPSGQNKRIDNSLLRQSGYLFQYPSYQQGYQQYLNHEKI